MNPGDPCGPLGLPASINPTYRGHRRSHTNCQQGLTKPSVASRGGGRLADLPAGYSGPKRKKRRPPLVGLRGGSNEAT
jgi:hypothetical protein